MKRKNKYFLVKNGVFRKESFGGLILLRNGFRYTVSFRDLNILKACNGRNMEEIIRLSGERKRYVASFLEEAKRKQIVTDREIDPIGKYVEYADPSDLYLGFPRNVFLECTYSCNQNCIHCYSNSGKRKGSELTKEKIFNLVDELSDNGTEFLSIGGGEPLVYPHISDVISYALNKGVEVELATNATLITDKIIDKLKSIPLKYIQVSLDGADSETYYAMRKSKDYHRVISNIKKLVKADFETTIAAVVTTLNIAQIFDILKLAEELGVKYFRVIRLIEVGRGKNDLSLQPNPNAFFDLLKKLQHESKIRRKIKIYLAENVVDPTRKAIAWLPKGYYGCSAGRSVCSINPKGDVFPCSYLNYPELKCGNVKENRLLYLWHNASVFKQFRERKHINGKCSTCDFLVNCLGGCRAIAYATSGKIDGSDLSCAMI